MQRIEFKMKEKDIHTRLNRWIAAESKFKNNG